MKKGFFKKKFYMDENFLAFKYYYMTKIYLIKNTVSLSLLISHGFYLHTLKTYC